MQRQNYTSQSLSSLPDWFSNTPKPKTQSLKQLEEREFKATLTNRNHGKRPTFNQIFSPIANENKLNTVSRRSARFELSPENKLRTSSRQRSKSSKRLRDSISIERVSNPHRNDFQMFKPNVKVRQIRHVFKKSEKKNLEHGVSPLLTRRESFLRTEQNKKEDSCFVFTPNESMIENDHESHISIQEQTPNKPKFHDIQGIQFAASKRISTGAASPHEGSEFDCQFNTEGSEDLELPSVQV